MYTLIFVEVFLSFLSQPFENNHKILCREIWEKVNVTWLDGGNKVEFGNKKTYHFRRDLSTADEDTRLILPNLPMIVRFFCLSTYNILILLLAVATIYGQPTYL